MVTRRLAVAIIFLVIAVFTTTSAWGAVIYVKQNSPGPTLDGASWATAFHKVQDALNAAAAGDEVWVAAGTYVENLSVLTRTALYGGFAGTETARDDRDWQRHPTIFDGNKAGSVVKCNTSNGYPIKIDGFTITNGYDTYYSGGIQGAMFSEGPTGIIVAHCCITNNTGGYGGAIHSGDAPVISDCRITNNTALSGGGIHALQGAFITGCTISDNTALYAGGGLCVWTDARVEKCVFRNNRASVGGAIYGEDIPGFVWYRLDIKACKFLGNCAVGYTDRYTTTLARGGAVCLYNRNSSPAPLPAGFDVQIAGSFFSGNTAADSGSALYLQNCGSFLLANSFAKNGLGTEGTISLEQCLTQFTGNILAFNASGFKWNAGTLNYENNCVYQNTAYDFSGAAPSGNNLNNISADPKFADALKGNLHIQPDSPCIDTGSDAILSGISPVFTDIDGHTRLIGDHVDIGADESNGVVWGTGQLGVVYVSPNGRDDNDGSSWAKAKKTIQAGIDTASEQVAEVWVAAGTYNERITLRSNAWLYGGFNGNETDKSQRDWKTVRTVIDGTPAQGESGGSVVTITGIPYKLSCIDGFVIQGGTGTSYNGSKTDFVGGGIYCYASAISITHNVIKNNSVSFYGAGIFCSNSSCRIIGNEICSNTAMREGLTSARGGAIWCENAQTLIANNYIWGNYAYGWGGVVLSGPVTFVNNTVVDNFSRVLHNGYTVLSSAVAIRDHLPSVANNIIAYNAGGIWCGATQETIVKFNCVYKNRYTDHTDQRDPSIKVLFYDTDIDADPGFAALSFSDYHLQAGSPCIDAGSNQSAALLTEDMDREPRVRGNSVDIGADESNGNVWNATPYVICVGTGSNWPWTEARATIQEAIDALPPCGGEVWVKAGDYQVGANGLHLRDHVQVYGGFAGIETGKSQRDWSKNVTRLIGNGSSVVIADAGCIRSSVDGFTITGGTPVVKGGGVFCAENSSVTLAHNKIVDNRTVQPGTFGGGIYSSAGAYTSILNNLIKGNAASEGAGAWVEDTGVITGNTIVANTAASTGGGGLRTGRYDMIFNNIIAFNTGYGIAMTGYPEANRNCLYGNTPDNTSMAFNGVNLSTDPGFVDKDAGDYRLSPTSPCIDFGVNDAAGVLAADLDARDRIFFGTVDCGAYELYDLPLSTAALKASVPQTKVRIMGIVTAVFGSQFYIESPDRSSGIGCLMANHSMTVGDVAYVTGTVAINGNLEKYLLVTQAVANGKQIIEPLVMSNRSVGGGSLNYDSSTQKGQAGVTGGTGPNNIGLLVKVTGRVTAAGSGYFYIDDGSGVHDNSQFAGIKVMAAGMTPPAVGSQVSATGISVPLRSSSTVFRMIKARNAADIVVYQQ